jgi:hypothetical protein
MKKVLKANLMPSIVGAGPGKYRVCLALRENRLVQEYLDDAGDLGVA